MSLLNTTMTNTTVFKLNKDHVYKSIVIKLLFQRMRMSLLKVIVIRPHREDLSNNIYRILTYLVIHLW